MSRAIVRRLHNSSRLFQEEKVPRKRIINGLNERHRTMVEGGIPPLSYEQQRDKEWLGQHFGRYGLASGVDIRQLWPTEIKEITDAQLNRKAAESVLIAERIAREEEQKHEKHVSNVKQNLAGYDKVLEEYRNSLAKPMEQKTDDELLKERRIQEIQEYFGYWIDPSDPRFDVMLKQKEAEEKKAEKQAKKDEKRKKTIAATS